MQKGLHIYIPVSSSDIFVADVPLATNEIPKIAPHKTMFNTCTTFRCRNPTADAILFYLQEPRWFYFLQAVQKKHTFT